MPEDRGGGRFGDHAGAGDHGRCDCSEPGGGVERRRNRRGSGQGRDLPSRSASREGRSSIRHDQRARRPGAPTRPRSACGGAVAGGGAERARAGREGCARGRRVDPPRRSRRPRRRGRLRGRTDARRPGARRHRSRLGVVPGLTANRLAQFSASHCRSHFCSPGIRFGSNAVRPSRSSAASVCRPGCRGRPPGRRAISAS